MVTAQFRHFRTSGLSSPQSGQSTRLGPATDEAMRNGMELCFLLSETLPAERVRFRRTIHERVWQKDVPGAAAGTGYHLLFEHGPGAADHPPEGLGLDNLPLAFDVDLPGFSPWWSPSSRTITITDTVALEQRAARRRATSDQNATELIMKHNFTQWLEVRGGSGWRRVGTRIEWFDVLHIIWNRNRWRVGRLTRIDRGTAPLNPF
ncbi:MAG: hypothetical protein AAGF59_02455 [Pseudomonadota bacterium]